MFDQLSMTCPKLTPLRLRWVGVHHSGCGGDKPSADAPCSPSNLPSSPTTPHIVVSPSDMEGDDEDASSPEAELLVDSNKTSVQEDEQGDGPGTDIDDLSASKVGDRNVLDGHSLTNSWPSLILLLTFENISTIFTDNILQGRLLRFK